MAKKMAKKKQRARVALRQRLCTRIRVGRVSVYEHHGAWWLDYRDDDKVVRRRIGHDQATAEKLASEVNGQLAIDAPTPFAFNPVSVKDLRDRLLPHHETVLTFPTEPHWACPNGSPVFALPRKR